jgi:hypothetical protein
MKITLLRTSRFSQSSQKKQVKHLSQSWISYRHLLMAIEFGVATFKQGLIYYTVGSKNIPDYVDSDEARKLNNMVVVVSSDGVIITSYKSDNGIKHVRRKRSDLYKTKKQ